MGFNFHFCSLGDEKELGELIAFIRAQDLEYPKYQDWVSRTEGEIISGWKIPILAFSEGRLVGEIIYQEHKKLPRTIEMKNIRIHPFYAGRGFAYFLIKQIEAETKGHDAIICDVRENKRDIISFLRFSGYEPILKKPLYDENNHDIVFIKTFTEKTPLGILHRVHTLFS